jgi:Mycothiol maleylpyruvate isomerase N-terminal domain
MNDEHDEAVSTLAAELDSVEELVRGLSPEAWNQSTLLEPFDAGSPPWTVKELVAHIDISIGLTLGFLDSIQTGQPGRDRVSFFIADRSQVAPIVYDYAKGLAAQHTPESLSDKLGETFRATVAGARQHPAETVGSGYFALMRLDEWIPSRTVEAVVHGLDLTDALGAAPIAGAGVGTTKSILDDLLARRTVPGRPADLGDDLAFIRAAAGRAKHSDPRFPLVV